MPLYQIIIITIFILAFFGVLGHILRCYYLDRKRDKKIHFKIHKVDADEPHWDCGNN